jgi:acyl carrier protein
MGLVDKTNPFATRETLLRQAVLGGLVAGVGYGVACHWHPALVSDWWFALPGAIAVGAALGFLLDWQELDLIDITWVVKAVEKEFGIKIPEQDWQAIETVGDLQACVQKLLGLEAGARSMEASDDQEIFSRIKSAIVKGLGIGAEEVEPSTRFGDDLRILTYPKAMELVRARQNSG